MERTRGINTKAVIAGFAIFMALAISAIATPGQSYAAEGGPEKPDTSPRITIPVFRLYNQYTGEHLLTANPYEYNALENQGWTGENFKFESPEEGTSSVYRLYNPNNGDHFYTADLNEYGTLCNNGWRGEGPQFFQADSDDEAAVEVLRLWNTQQVANGGSGSHLWTVDQNEYVTLPDVSGGAWRQEGRAWLSLEYGTGAAYRDPSGAIWF